MMRAGLRGWFDSLGDADVALFVDGWFEENTQRVLQELVARLKSRG